MPGDSARRAEILETAARLIAHSGARTSLQEIADAAGILPGSLYHHFESKDAIVHELVERYRADLDRIAAEAIDHIDVTGDSIEGRIVGFGEQIAACAVRHRAALLLTFFDTPRRGPDIPGLGAGTPPSIHAALLKIMEGPGARGYFRAGVDRGVFADRLCQSMLHIGIGDYHRSRAAAHMAATKCGILLHGLAEGDLPAATLERSAARTAAQRVVEGWAERAEDDRASTVRAAARSEFARRGFEITTIRDIAAEAGVSTGGVYRLVDSKDQLLALIMTGYVGALGAGWKAVMASDSSAAQKLDALLWFDVRALANFGEEHRILSTWLRQAPPTSANLPLVFPAQLRALKSLLSAGIGAGTFRADGTPLDLRARCLLSVVWTPENIVQKLGLRGAHLFTRSTVLFGAVRNSMARTPST